MYSEIEKVIVLNNYHQFKPVTKVIRQLCYPTRSTLYKWLSQNKEQPKEKRYSCRTNFAKHPRNPSHEIKLDIIYRCFELGEDVKLVSEEIGYSRTSIYKCRRRYIREGRIVLMNKKNKPHGELQEVSTKRTDFGIEKLLDKINEMQMEIDILKETIMF